MGLATRIIPTLLYRGDVLVKGKRFDSWRSVGHVLQAARIHAARGVDELICLDIAATPEGRGPNLALVEKITESAFTPITVGGGVRSVKDVRDLLKAGADKVAIGTNHHIIREAADKFGRQAIVAAVDSEHGLATTQCGRTVLMDANCAHVSALDHAKRCVEAGAGEILLTSIGREGTMDGYDLDLIRVVSAAVDVPVIAHGGGGGPADMLEAIRAGASAVAAGALFQFKDTTPRDSARYLARHGVEVRV